MGIYSEVYEFAARAGAFEGYVYQRENLDPPSLAMWVDHIIRGYRALPPEVRAEFQDFCDGTVGRAVRSLIPAVGEDHELVRKLKELVTAMPSSPDDFHRIGEGRG